MMIVMAHLLLTCALFVEFYDLILAVLQRRSLFQGILCGTVVSYYHQVFIHIVIITVLY